MTQVSMNRVGEATSRAPSAATMKMPEPIIDPITMVVASSRRSPLTSSTGVAPVARVEVVVASIRGECFASKGAPCPIRRASETLRL
jgi:hypothetical protein